MDSQKFDLLMLEIKTLKGDIKELNGTVKNLEIKFTELDTQFKIKIGKMGIISSSIAVAAMELIKRFQ